MEIDETGVDARLRVDPARAGETRGSRGAEGEDGGHAAVVAEVHGAGIDDRRLAVGRHHGAGEDECHGYPSGACQIRVWPSSGDGRATAVRAPFSRAQASSPRNAGAPNGRSARGISSWSASVNTAP